MADDKNKEDETKAETGKKKVLPPLIMVAVGAILGGAGVVFGLPPRPSEVAQQPPPAQLVDLQHPDLLELTVNPRVETGKGFASIKFYFVYTVREDQEREAFESIKMHWARAKSNCLLLAGARTMRELQSDAGKRTLANDLMAELDRTLFPAYHGQKIATVSEILWDDFILQ